MTFEQVVDVLLRGLGGRERGGRGPLEMAAAKSPTAWLAVVASGAKGWMAA